MRKIKWIIIALIILLLIITSITFVNNYFGERAKTYAYKEAEKNANLAISNSISNEIIDLIKNDIYTYNEKNVIINTSIINEILKKTNIELNNVFKELEVNYLQMPFSILFSEILFTNSKLKMNIKTRPVNSFKTDIVTKVEEYGINNSVVSVNLVIIIDIELLIPFNRKEVTVETNLPLAIIICEGDVPPGIIYSNSSS